MGAAVWFVAPRHVEHRITLELRLGTKLVSVVRNMSMFSGTSPRFTDVHSRRIWAAQSAT
jgi:hypothetical protein